MGTFEIFNITFSTQPPVYYVGQAVAGCVNLNLKNDMEVRNIQIQMTGTALVSIPTFTTLLKNYSYT